MGRVKAEGGGGTGSCNVVGLTPSQHYCRPPKEYQVLVLSRSGCCLLGGERLRAVLPVEAFQHVVELVKHLEPVC